MQNQAKIKRDHSQQTGEWAVLKTLGWLCAIAVFSSVISFAILSLVQIAKADAARLYFAIGSVIYVLVLVSSGILDRDR